MNHTLLGQSCLGGELFHSVPSIPNHTLYLCIGRGSYGEVWLARDSLDKWRAVKVVSHRKKDRGERAYQREFNAVSAYEEISRQHGALMPILSVGRDSAEKSLYYSMELADDARTNGRLDVSQASPDQIGNLIEGYQPRTLRAELRQQGRLPAALCVEYGIALATALEQLHGSGLVHRDIKPDNIIFVHEKPKLADIGLVADIDATRSYAGTQGYCPPEGPGSPSADIYSLGKVLYEMATGRDVGEFPSPPKEFGALSERERKGINELNSVFLKACDPEVRQRQDSVKALREELELLKQGGSVQRLRKLERTTKWLWLAIKGAVALVLLGSLFLGNSTLRNRAAEERRRVILREIQISRLRLRQDGWFSNYWGRLREAAAVRKDRQVLEQASALLAGLDARPVTVIQGVRGASATFAPDGRALISGLETDPLVLLDKDGVKTELPVRGEGPVCWPSESTPLQLMAVTNGLVLREALTGNVKRRLAILGARPSPPEAAPGLALTPDGSLIAATFRSRLFVWKAATSELLGDVSAEATALALSPDGTLVGVGRKDGSIRVYAVRFDRSLSSGFDRSLTLPDGRHSEDGTSDVSGMTGLVPVAVLPPALRGNPILCLAFARDRVVPYGAERRTNSWLLASGDKGAGIVIWDLDRRLPRSVCRGATWNVAAIAFSPDGITLAAAGRNPPRLWDVATGQPLLVLSEVSAGESLALAFDATGEGLICGGEPGAGQAKLVLWRLEPHRGIQPLRGLVSSIRKVWFSPASRHVAALSDDWHLAVWENALDRLIFCFETPVGTLADNAAGCFDATGERFAFASGQEACLYHLNNGTLLRRWSLANGLSDQLQFDAQGQLLLLRRERASEQRASIWRLYELGNAQKAILRQEQKETNWLTEELAFAFGGERFLVWSGGAKGIPRVIRAYDARIGRESWTAITERTGGNSRLRLDPIGTSFAYNPGSEDDPLRLVRLTDFEATGMTPKYCQAIGPSGRGFAGNSWVALDATSPGARIELGTDWEYAPDTVTFSPNGKLLAWGTLEGVVLVADIQEVRRRLALLSK